MRIAIPNENGQIAAHMAQCSTFTLIDVQEDGTFSKENITLEHTGNAPMMKMLAEQKAQVLICGEMGLMTRSALEMLEIEMVPGCSGAIDTAVDRYLKGEKQGDDSILSVEIVMDENDPMQCMHDCAKCGGCHSVEIPDAVQKRIPEA